MLFDSHVHFDTIRGNHGIAALVERATRAGISAMVAVGGSPTLNRHAITAARWFPDTISAAIGWDRDQILNPYRRELAANPQKLCDGLRRRITRCRKLGIRICALGEIGLDYHYAPETARDQCRMMRGQLAAARELELPVIVHTREADADTLALLNAHVSARSKSSPKFPGVVHCFTGTTEFAKRILDLGFFIGLSGIVTFAKADTLHETATTIPAEKLLIETDTPYLAPVPHRGHRNEPAFLPAILQRLAEIRHEPADRLAETTRANTRALFSI